MLTCGPGTESRGPLLSLPAFLIPGGWMVGGQVGSNRPPWGAPPAPRRPEDGPVSGAPLQALGRNDALLGGGGGATLLPRSSFLLTVVGKILTQMAGDAAPGPEDTAAAEPSTDRGRLPTVGGAALRSRSWGPSPAAWKPCTVQGSSPLQGLTQGLGLKSCGRILSLLMELVRTQKAFQTCLTASPPQAMIALAYLPLGFARVLQRHSRSPGGRGGREVRANP